MREQYPITGFNNLDEKLMARITTKSQLISILITVIRVILTDTSIKDEERGHFCIREYEGKRRIFFTLKDNDKKIKKHFSFSFPCKITSDENGISFSIYNSDVQINLFTLEVLSALSLNNWFSDINDNGEDLKSLYENFCFIVEEFYLTDEMKMDIWSIVKFLMTFEASYIRYDYDEKNYVEYVHPLHHLDIFYSDSSTFKLGINTQIGEERLGLEDFEDILLDGKVKAKRCYTIA